MSDPINDPISPLAGDLQPVMDTFLDAYLPEGK